MCIRDRAQAFGLKIIAFDPYIDTDVAAKMDVEPVDFETLLKSSDYLSIHVPMMAETENLFGADAFKKMKPDALLINTARGPLVDEAALAKALNEGQIAGAATDVLSVEPPPADNPLFGAKNLIITPHIGWATRAARKRLMGIAVENLKAHLDGAPVNVVN